MGRVVCWYYATDAGKIPVQDFIDTLDPRSQRKFFFTRGLLEEFGRELTWPHAKHVLDGVFELRFHGREGRIRVLYFFAKDKAILTNGFVKKTSRILPQEIAVSLERRRLYEIAQS